MKKNIVITGLLGAFFWVAVGCSAGAPDEQVAQIDQAISENGNSYGNGPFQIWSSDFEDGAALPDSATCEGKAFAEGDSPKLKWNEGPEGTQSYAIVLADTTLLDANLPNFGFHWAIWNIPAPHHILQRGIPGLNPDNPGEVVPLSPSIAGAEQSQARGVERFFGPCPSWQNHCSGGEVPRANDSYSFTLYALPEAHYDVPAYDTEVNTNYVDTLNSFFASNAIGSAVLTATSDASPSSAPFCP